MSKMPPTAKQVPISDQVRAVAPLENTSTNSRWNVFLNISVGTVLMAVLALPLTYFIWFGFVLNEPLSPNQSTWGAFGDFVGGLLNPLVALAALGWLTFSVRLQKTELHDTRKALEESQKAQQEQARLALVSVKTESLNIRLAAISANLSHLRNSQLRILERAETVGIRNRVFDYDGEYVICQNAIESLQERIGAAVAAQNEIIERLNETELDAELYSKEFEYEEFARQFDAKLDEAREALVEKGDKNDIGFTAVETTEPASPLPPHSESDWILADAEEKVRYSTMTIVAELSPTAAVLAAWAELSNITIKSLELSGHPPPGSQLNSSRLGHALLQAGLIDDAEFKIFHKLRDMRNKAAHAPDVISSKQAKEYIALVQRLSKKIRRA